MFSLIFGRPANQDMAIPRVVLMLVVLALTLVGFVMIYSASSISAITEDADAWSYLRDQLLFAVVGIGFAFLFWRVIPYRIWESNAIWVFWGISIVLLVATAVAGVSALGAQRWLSIGPFSLQPSEIAKVAIVLMGARIMFKYQTREYELRALIISTILFVIVPMALLYKSQSDLGTTAIIAVGILGVMWFGNVKWQWMVAVLALVFAFGLYSIFGTGYRSDRMLFLNPWDDGEDGHGAGYQIIHSMYAFSQGGLFGVGLGNSREKYLYLPESETDFIFAIIGEELGFVGAALIIIAFLVLLWAGLQIAQNAEDSFGGMVAGALAMMLVAQAFLNIGCAIDLFPTTGKPLPFISSGGSSLVASFTMIGIILSVADGGSTLMAERDNSYERRRGQFRVMHVDDSGAGARSRARR